MSMKLPVLFLAHGSPMRALQKDDFSEKLNQLGQKIGKPKVILSISAHWMTRGSFVTSADQPKQIYDMYGFPDELYKLKYAPRGDSAFAQKMTKELAVIGLKLDEGNWGIDHGTWSVLTHLYPTGDVPVLQLSLDMSQRPEFFYKLGQLLARYRDEGVLIIGSGNIVHNLRRINWGSDSGADWAIEFDLWVKEKLISGDMSSLVQKFHDSEVGRLSVPTLDHYLPMLVVLGAALQNDNLSFIYEKLELGGISMTSFSLGSEEI